jgi:hypothetical protein
MLEITQSITIKVSQGKTLEMHSLHFNAIKKIGKNSQRDFKAF